MKLLCDVCSDAVASVFCCADEAALCSSCDSRVHSANKLASKHQRISLVSATPAEQALCDICQETPSFFFCVEDRALLCRECDLSVHSANAFAAKHCRFLLTHIKAEMYPTESKCEDSGAAATMEQPSSLLPASMHADYAVKAPQQQAVAVPVPKNFNQDNGADMCASSKALPHSHKASKSALSPAPKSLASYLITKDGTLSTVSTTNLNSEVQKAAANAHREVNSTTITIQRISAGLRVPIVAPVLSSIQTALLREEAFQVNKSKDLNNINNTPITSGEHSSDSCVMVDVDSSLPATSSDRISDYMNSSLNGWRLDELLTDLVGACDDSQSASPIKEALIPGLDLEEEHAWFSDLDFAEDNRVSPSQKDSVALVPEMPDPPTNSDLGASQGKWASFPPVRHWDLEYLFMGPAHLKEFSVVPNASKHRSIGDSSDSPDPVTVKRRKHWINTKNGETYKK